MAPFLSRLFSSHSQEKQEVADIRSERNIRQELHGFPCLRVLLYRERFGQERKLLFDSKAVQKRLVPGNTSCGVTQNWRQSSVEKSFGLDSDLDDIFYEWQRQSPDEKMLREMVFGSIPTAYQGCTTKVHMIRSPFQFVISIVYGAPSAAKFQLGKDSDETDSSKDSACPIVISREAETGKIHMAYSVPVNMPSYSHHLDTVNDFYESLDDQSCLSENLANMTHSGSFNNLQRRLERNKVTSIQLGMQKLDDTTHSDLKMIANETRVKLGLSMLLTPSDKIEEARHFEDFLFTHISLIENHFMRLKDMVNSAYLDRKKFLYLMHEGTQKLQSSMQDLYSAPRLQFPMWLSLISAVDHQSLCELFMDKLTHTLKLYDIKQTNFFLSTLLTAVLANHLAWIPTVIPADAKLCLDRQSHKHMSLWVSLLAKYRPYNPLWIQLRDLFGSVSKPCKITKVVIKGCKAEMILLFLQVISYFMRCSEICEHFFEKSQLQSCGSIHKSFGWSLIGGVSDHYLEDFCLQGVQGSLSEAEIIQDLQRLLQSNVLGEPISEAVCILADIDTWNIRLHSRSCNSSTGSDISETIVMQAGMSEIVSNICEAILNLKETGLSSKSCVLYLEDRLQELYCHSVTMSDYVRSCRVPSLENVATALRLNPSDIPLLLSIAKTHSPQLRLFQL